MLCTAENTAINASLAVFFSCITKHLQEKNAAKSQQKIIFEDYCLK